MNSLMRRIKRKIKRIIRKIKNKLVLLTVGRKKWYELKIAFHQTGFYRSYQILKSTLFGHYFIKKYSVISAKEFCEISDDSFVPIDDHKSAFVYCPEFYGVCNSKEVECDPLETYIARLKNISLTGAATYMLNGRYCIYDDMAYDFQNRLEINFPNVLSINKEKALIQTDKQVQKIAKGIDLIGFASYNYYHFLFEIVSRLRFIDEFSEYDDYPVIVDDVIDCTSQLKEIINAFNIKKREIITVKKYQTVHVDDLIYPSYNTRMPLNVRSIFDVVTGDFALVPGTVGFLRKRVENLAEQRDKKKKIFLSRKNSSNSRLKNETEISELFVKCGFEVIHTDQMTFEEQVKTFCNASVVVGASGAALANIAFCEPGTKFVCIIPEKYHFYMYSTIAHQAGLECIFLSPDVIEKSHYSAADLWRLDPAVCERFINEKLSSE